MLDWIERMNWDEYLFHLSQGSPSVWLQLVAVNAMLAAYWLFQRGRKRKIKAQRPSTWMLQLLFVVGNLGILTWGSRLSF